MTPARSASLLLALLLGLVLAAGSVVGAEPWAAPAVRRVAAGLHDGDLVGARLRPDGQWVAYGILEKRADGSIRSRYFARSLVEDATFRSIWPTQHPSFEDSEGTASFTDLLDFQWHPQGRHNAMVVRHKSKGGEVMLELLKVRFGGPGDQDQPVFSRDGSQVVVVAEGELGRELWHARTEHEAELEQLTWTRDSERWPDFHPTAPKILHEIRNRSTKRSDLFVFDLEYYEQQPLIRLEESDEIHPSWSPDGERFVFLSNKDDPSGQRYDLFSGRPGDVLFQTLAQGVRVSERSRGYCWDPQGRFLLFVKDDRSAGHPLTVVASDGSQAPRSLEMPTRDNQDPDLVVDEAGLARLAWTAEDTEPRGGSTWRVVYVAELPAASLAGRAGLGN